MQQHKGLNGTIGIEPDAVVIIREGMVARNAFGKDVPPRRVPLSEITGVVHKPAGKFANGHLQILRNGQREPGAAPAKDPDGLQYPSRKSYEFESLAAWLQTVAEKNNRGAAGAGAAGVPAQQSGSAWYQKHATQLIAAALFGMMLGSCAGGDDEQTITTLQANYAAAEEKADGWKTRADAVEADLKEAQRRVTELEGKVRTAEGKARTAEAKVAEAQAAPPPAPEPAAPVTQPEPAAPPPAAPAAPASAYYANCSEARAAGAAPIRQGQPGYRKGLDRDGDGVACDK